MKILLVLIPIVLIVGGMFLLGSWLEKRERKSDIFQEITNRRNTYE